MRVRGRESRPEPGDRWHCASPRGRARDTLDDVAAGVDPVAFVAGEEKRAVLEKRPAGRPTKLIELQRRLGDRRCAPGLGDDAPVGVTEGVEVVRGIELVAAEVF